MTREEAIKMVQAHKFPRPMEEWQRLNNEAIDMAIEALQEVQKHEETFEWCTDCKEYDKDNYCCHRWSKMIRNTVEELKEYSGLVRCKDCKWAEKAILDEYCVECTMYHTSCMKHGYCHHGERREP